MKLIECFRASNNPASTHSWILAKLDNTGDVALEDLAKFLAELIIEHKCRGCPEKYHLWKQHLDGGEEPSGTAREALKAFIEPVFGLPENPDVISQDHLEGYVAEYLWYFLSLEGLTGESVVRIEPPGFTPTDPGGDGLVIHGSTSTVLMFRLWEIKKCGGTSTVSSTVRRAYNQLDKRATKYLARYTAIGQEISDQRLADFYGQLIDLWVDARPEASAGVSIATCVTRIPARCFTTFGKHFPQFTKPVRLRGMLTAIQDFPTFTVKVREYVWKGL
ncbi:hypothetical protein ES703_40502 [subsurface metagenome]